MTNEEIVKKLNEEGYEVELSTVDGEERILFRIGVSVDKKGKMGILQGSLRINELKNEMEKLGMGDDKILNCIKSSIYEIKETNEARAKKNARLQEGNEGKFERVKKLCEDITGEKRNLRIGAMNTEEAEEDEKEIGEIFKRRISEKLCCFLYMVVENSEKGIGIAKIPKKMVEHLGVSEKELWEAAEKNTLQELVIKDVLEGEECDFLKHGGKILEVTNTNTKLGTGAIGCAKALKKISEKLGTKEFIIIPASKHFFIAIKRCDWEEFDEVVENVAMNARIGSKSLLDESEQIDCTPIVVMM